jgi:hypothetical protein
MRVTIHQPEFMPWLGFFHKASLADVLVLLDDGQFRKNYFHNRNRTRTPEGWRWVTIPIEKAPLGTPITGIKIAGANNPRWKEKIGNGLRMSYSRSPFFEDTVEGFSEILDGTTESLSDLNIALLEWMLPRFNLSPQILRASDFDLQSSASQRILDICLRTGATTYVSGISGSDYLDLPAFKRAGIEVEIQDFHHPIYDQLFPGFEPQISSIEALFLYGHDANLLIQDQWPDKVDQVFR